MGRFRHSSRIRRPRGPYHGSHAGPAGSTPGGLAGVVVVVVVVGPVGSFVGGSAGAAVGEMFDETVFDNFECLEYSFRFSVDLE